MASVTMHKNSKYWSARYRDSNGQRHTRSTKLPRSDRKKAQQLADDWEKASQGRLAASHIQRNTAVIMREVSGEESKTYTIKEYLLNWCAEKKHTVAPSTHEKYEYCIGEFLRYMGVRADKPLLFSSEADMLGFRDECIKQNSPKTVNSKLKTLGSAFREAWESDYLTEDITKRRKRWKLRNPVGGNERAPFTQEQVDNIIKSSSGEWKGIACFGAYTGQRLGDIISLRWGDISGGYVCITTKKTQRAIRVPVSDKISQWLKFQTGEHRPNQRLFPESYATYVKNRHKTAPLSKQFRAILAALGYAPKRIFRTQGKGRKAARPFSPLSFHSFRHYLTSEMHRAGVPVAVIKDIIGHDSEAVHRIYTHVDDAAKQQAFSKLFESSAPPSNDVSGALDRAVNGGPTNG